MILRFKDIKQKIKEEISKRVPGLRCPICNGGKMVLIDGFVDNYLKDEITDKFSIGKSSVPTVMLICVKCGHVIEFSIGAFGLLPKKDEEQKEKEKTEDKIKQNKNSQNGKAKKEN